MSSTPVNQKGKESSSFYLIIRQALSGEHQDFTSGSIRRAVILLSVPMILEMCMESVFGVVDIFFVGRLGKGAVAAVGLTESVLTVVYCIAIGLSMAATAVVARRIGEKNPEEAAHSGAQAIVIGIVLTLAISVAGIVLAPRILQAMGASADTALHGAPFTRIIFGGSIVIMMLFLINGIFRGAGQASIAMWSLWVANGFNIILCPIFIGVFGLKGAAIATTIGRGLGVCFQLYHLAKGKGVFRILRKYFRPDPAIIRSLLKIASTGTLQFLIGSASWIAMVRIISHYGDATIAGYQVAIRILLFFLMPAWGMSNAAATLVGQNLGARKPDRAEKSVQTTAKYNALFMLLVSVIFFAWASPVVSFINKDPGVEEIAVRALRIVSLGYVFYGVGMVLTNAFNGAGDTRTPTVINLFCFWMFQIPLAWFLARVLELGPKGVFLAILISETAITIVSFLVFRKGRWKEVKV